MLGTDLVDEGNGLFLGSHWLGIADKAGTLLHKLIGAVSGQGCVLRLHWQFLLSDNRNGAVQKTLLAPLRDHFY